MGKTESRIGRIVAVAVGIGAVLFGAAWFLQERALCSSGLSCLWEVSKHPLWIALVAWILASWYQTGSRVSGLRYNAFDRAASIQSRLIEAGWKLLLARALVKALRIPSITVLAPPEQCKSDEKSAESSLDEVHREAAALAVVNSVLFSARTQRNWLDLMRHYHSVRFGDSLRESYNALRESSDLWVVFIRAAALEIPIKFEEVVLPTQQLQESREKIEEMLDKLEPTG